MEILLYIVLLLPLPILLNRLRGTGNIYKGITGTMLYALYFGLLVGTLSYISDVRFIALQEITSSITIYLFDMQITFSVFAHSVISGIFAIGLFLFGESFAFGKWVGYLVDYEDEHSPEYDSKVGKSFPYIHYVANAIVSERVNYKKYCQVALAIRGFVWFAPMYAVLGVAGVINWIEVVAISMVLAVGFPIAAYIGRNWDYNARFGVLEFKRGWENQEVVYGLIQGMCLWYVILKVVYE